MERVDKFDGAKRIHCVGDAVSFPSIEAFGTGVITRLDVHPDGTCYATICRPYMYASPYGNAPMVGYETIGMVSTASIEAHYPLVGQGRVTR